MKSKKELEVKLSKLEDIGSPKVFLEQYPTPSAIAGEVLWLASLKGDIKDKIIADFGCGNGILGIGASLLGAKKVIFLDSDRESLLIAKKNFEALDLKNAVFLHQDVSKFHQEVDTVIQNPPFGVQQEHADKGFLEVALKHSKSIYSFHKLESKGFIEALIRDSGFKLGEILSFKFPLKKSQKFHTKLVHVVEVGCFILRKGV